MALWVSTGCGSGTGTPEGGDFVSDNPGGEPGGGTAAGEDGGTGEPNGDGGDDGAREITEADIVHVEDDRLYALSRYGGLAVVDVSDPDTALPVLGRYRAHAQPFEMYVDAGSVFVMYSDWGTYDWDETVGGWSWRSSTRLVALDASDPADIAVRGELDMPGYIQDSRRVGDVLYLVTHEDGYCWGCNEQIRTVVTSLDVSNPAEVAIVDQLAFVDAEADQWGWGGQRSVTATDERIYVAGLRFDDFEDSHSVIDVVDISDPGGALTQGAAVAVAGQIQSRWQMDEHEGVLRVVSQPGFWGSTNPPVIETFSVASASDVAPLGSASMTLPRPESLRSVRFDGTRGYAITFEQTDPLFTLDLSDPAAPQQVGELEIPGWVFHMEPREDRVLGLGFDPGNPEGALNVSLFDVSDFANPSMLSRVHFGGDWAYLGEDQNRIHKAFTILDELGLILVPFSGWSYDEGDWEECRGSYESGIQLVDWADDALVARGFADSHGEARRALVHRERLIGMSDMAVESFDISDRDAPQKRAELALATNVASVAIDDGIMARLSQDWWTGESRLEIVDLAHAEEPEALGRLDLSSLVTGNDCWDYGFWGAEVFAHAGRVYLVRELYDRDTGEPSTRIEVIDARDPAAPVHLQSLEIPDSRDFWGYGLGFPLPEERTVKVGDALVLFTGHVDYEGNTPHATASFVVVDLHDPGAPTISATIERPSGLQHGALQVHDGTIVSWHMRPVEGDTSKVRYYLERLDVSDPADPVASAAVNVPGAVVAYDPEAQRAVTVDFRLESQALPADDCWNHPQVYDYDHTNEMCVIGHRELRLVALQGDEATLLQTLDVEGDSARVSGIAAGSDRIFVYLGQGGWYGWAEDVGDGGPASYEGPTTEIATLTGLGSDTLEVASRVEIEQAGWWIGTLTASGHDLLFSTDNGLGELDTSDPSQPTLEIHDLWGYGCWDLQIAGETAYCSMGELGLQAIPLGG